MNRSPFLRGAVAAVLLTTTAIAWGQAAPGGRVTAHVLDLYTGAPANGMRIDFLAVEGNSSKVLKSVTTNADGRPPEGPLLTPDTKSRSNV